MDRRTALLTGGSLVLPAPAWPARPAQPSAAPRVVFLNPGEPVERGKGPHWRMTAHFMAAAAQALGLHLEVLYAERDHLLMLRQAEQVAGRADPPDYVIIVNEKQAALQMLRTLERLPSKVLLIHNDLTPEQRRQAGNERGPLRHWIGTVTTDETRAQQRLTAELVRQLGDQEPRVLAITGDRGTPVSLERVQGVTDQLARLRRGQVLQLAFSDWSHADAMEKAGVLLARYPQANIVWAANDSMALGALRAVQDRGAKVLVGGTGAWPEALAQLVPGGLAATVGSHFFIGAWAIVLLHDYHHGSDFATLGGPHLKLDYLVVVHRGNAAAYERAVYQQTQALDFRTYSRVLQPARPYRFDLARLLR